jgi:tetratricopeptide (TPR) repeat protein
MLIGALAIGWLRPRLAERYRQLKVTTDMYALPSPEQTVAFSLGYRAALADLLFANVLVSYGLHFQERRRFEYVGRYLETINALDPKFRAPYRFSDTLLTLAPVAPRLEDYRKAREILERGLRELPDDGELWLTAGQYLAYLAPGRLTDANQKHEWRMSGARCLTRACELLGKDRNLPYQCITAATIFSREGNREAVIQFLERVLAVTDNEEIRALALGYLERTVGEQQREQAERQLERFRAVWKADLPFLSKDELLVLGPRTDPAYCAGRAQMREASCASSWRTWADQESAGRGAIQTWR